MSCARPALGCLGCRCSSQRANSAPPLQCGVGHRLNRECVEQVQFTGDAQHLNQHGAGVGIPLDPIFDRFQFSSIFNDQIHGVGKARCPVSANADDGNRLPREPRAQRGDVLLLEMRFRGQLNSQQATLVRVVPCPVGLDGQRQQLGGCQAVFHDRRPSIPALSRSAMPPGTVLNNGCGNGSSAAAGGSPKSGARRSSLTSSVSRHNVTRPLGSRYWECRRQIRKFPAGFDDSGQGTNVAPGRQSSR